MSTPEGTLPRDNITEDSSDNSSTSSCSSTSTQLQTNITTKRTIKLPQTTDDHICTTGKREHTIFTTTTDKKKCNSTEQCHIDTVDDTPLKDTTLPVTTRNKKLKWSKENAMEVPDIPENQLNMQEHPNKKKKSTGFKGIETESLVESKSEKNTKKIQKEKFQENQCKRITNFT